MTPAPGVLVPEAAPVPGMIAVPGADGWEPWRRTQRTLTEPTPNLIDPGPAPGCPGCPDGPVVGVADGGAVGVPVGVRGRCRRRCRARSAACAGDRGARRLEVAVVDETLDAVGREGATERVRVDGQPGQRVRADGVENAVVVPGDHLDVAAEQDPVAWPGLVAVTERAPAALRLRVGHHGGDGGRVGVGVDPDVGPRGKRPRVARAAADPALLADRLGREFQGEAGERGARGAVVGAVAAGVVPDQRLHLGGGPGLREPQVVAGHVDDRRAQLRVARHAARAVGTGGEIAERAWPGRLLKREQVHWHVGRRGHRRSRPWNEVEPGDHAAGAHGHKRRCLLPPWPPDGTHGYHFPPSAITVLLAVRVFPEIVVAGFPASPSATLASGARRAAVTCRTPAGSAGSPAPAGHQDCPRSRRAIRPASPRPTACRPSTA